MINEITILLLIITIILSLITVYCTVRQRMQWREIKNTLSMPPDVIPQFDECHVTENIENDNRILIEDWVKGIKNTYGEQWDVFFDNMLFPLDEEEQKKMSILLWNIASCTMDLVKSTEDGAPARYKDNVALIAGNKKRSELKEKEFYRDPTTVPKRVIAVRDWLRLNGVDEEEVSVFGYRVNVSKKDDD